MATYGYTRQPAVGRESPQRSNLLDDRGCRIAGLDRRADDAAAARFDDVAVHKKDGYPYDYHRLLYTFRVKSRTRDIGIYRPRHHWNFSPGIRFKPDKQ